jgi:hypothetical protein
LISGDRDDIEERDDFATSSRSFCLGMNFRQRFVLASEKNRE